jgi:hypothetical protein
MRYSKGTIALSQTQDLPLLRQVMYSKYVTQTQLWQFMRHSGYELVYFRQECVGLFRPRNVTKIFAGFRGRQPSRLRARVSQ